MIKKYRLLVHTMTGTNGHAQSEAAHRPFRAWALQHDLISLLGGSADWRVQPSELGLDSAEAEDPVSAFKGQGYLRSALASSDRLVLRTRTSVTLWAAALVTDTLNQISPIGLKMPTTAFWITVSLVTAAMIFTAVVYPRLNPARFKVVEQCMLTFASLLIVYQCSVTEGANSPYLIWFLLTSYYAAYLMPTGQALLNVSWFSLLAIATLGLSQTDAISTVVLQLIGLITVIWVITRALLRQRLSEMTLERAVNFMAHADPLTSTANMRSFEQYLEELSRRDGQRFAILVADMNGLKGANAVFGHETGDGMVVRTARLMLRASGENDQVARFGGDEFAVVIPGGREGDLNRWRKEFEREVERHNAAVRGRLPQISVALGGALYPDDGVSPRDLIDVADKRMYESKVPAVAPPYEIDGVATPDAGRAFRSARFQDAPLYPVDLRDRMRFSSLNWLASGLLTIAAGVIAGPYTYPVAAAVCGAYALMFAAASETFRHVRLTRAAGKALDYGTLAFPFPATALIGGAMSPLLVTISLPVAFYAQNLKSRQALPRIAILLAGYSAGFWFFGEQGPVEQTRYFTSIAAMVVIAGIMQYSSGQQASALSLIRGSATMDQLTGLPNVYALRRDLDRAVRTHAANPTTPIPALIVVDLDDFRRANTLAGHRGGDEVLRAVAARLEEVAGQSQVYRVEGDEFAIIVHGLTGRALATFAERCARGVEHSHLIDGANIEVRASGGQASLTEGLAGDELMDMAEESLRRDKADRRGPDASRRSVLL